MASRPSTHTSISSDNHVSFGHTKSCTNNVEGSPNPKCTNIRYTAHFESSQLISTINDFSSYNPFTQYVPPQSSPVYVHPLTYVPSSKKCSPVSVKPSTTSTSFNVHPMVTKSEVISSGSSL